MDRTEPPVGAKTLLDLYKKWGDRWVVELLFDDLLDWSNWFIRRRLLPPLDLGSAGRGVKGGFDPPEHPLTSFHTILRVRFGGHRPYAPSF
jgi:hypothetical protein